MAHNNHPKVFISYSHDSKEHNEWVFKLYTHLRNPGGVDAIIDQVDLRLGNDLAFFMEEGLSTSNLVLCVCSKDYVEKANAGEKGVGYEKKIITCSLLKNANSNYVIPIIRNNNSQNKTPIFLGSAIYTDFRDDNAYLDCFEKLLYRIHDEDIKKKPELSKNPFDNSLANSIITKTTIEKSKYHNPLLKGVISFECSNNNGNFSVGTGENLFNMNWYTVGDRVACARGNIGYIPKNTKYPSLENVKNFDYSSYQRRVDVNEIVVWMNEHGRFLVTKLIEAKASAHGAHHDEVTFEYFVLGDKVTG